MSIILNNKKYKKVTFSSKKLQRTIGNWLGILKDEKFISQKKLDKVDKIFGTLLESIGIKDDCILSNFNKEDFTCFVFGSENISCLNMSLRWTDGFNFNSQLYVSMENKSYVYDLDNFSKANNISLVLRSYRITNPETGTIIERYISEYFYSMTVTNKDKRVTIKVEKKTQPYTGDFRLNNEDDFDNYLLSLTYPISIDDIYQRLYMLCLSSGITNPDIRIESIDNLITVSLKRQKDN